MKLQVELVWEAEDGAPSSSIYLTADGKILLAGSPLTEEDRQSLSLPAGAAVINVDRRLIEAVKTFL